MTKFFAVLLLPSLLSAQWLWQLPNPTGNPMMDLRQIDAQTIVAVGYGATILRSTDLGSTWKQVYTASDSITARLRGLHFIDANTGWAVGSNYYGFSKTVVLKTTDGGSTWKSATNGANGVLWDISFANPSIGYIVGEGGKIFRTVNGGTTWTSSASGTSNNLTTVWAVSESTAYAFGTGGSWRTTNQGSTWATYSVAPGAFPNVQNGFFFNADSGYIVGQSGAMYRSTDKGATWSPVSTGSSSSSYDGVYFVNGTHGFLTRGTTSFRRTTDRGATWTSSNLPFSASRTVLFTDQNDGLAFSTFGHLYRSTDGGATWSPAAGHPAADMYQTYFLDANTGYAVGDGELVLRTTNGGATWVQRRYTGSQFSYESVFFITAETGWAAGEGGIISKTTDGGMTWTPQSSQLATRIKSVYFRDAMNGWICADNGGGIARTTDGGSTWSKSGITDLSGQSLYDIAVPDGKNGAVRGSSIFITADSGATWTKRDRLTNVSSLSTVHAGLMVAATTADSLFRSADAGVSWTAIAKKPTIKPLTHLVFKDASNGWGIGGAGTVSRTTDGGISWTAETVPYSEASYQHLFVIDSAHAWIAGSYGLILGKTPRAATSVRESAPTGPSTFRLEQSYPNPFNPTTTIRYRLSEPGNVSLTVYDGVGRVVERLVERRQDAGEHRATFDAGARASGVYYYRLIVDGRSEVRKMMLMK